MPSSNDLSKAASLRTLLDTKIWDNIEESRDIYRQLTQFLMVLHQRDSKVDPWKVYILSDMISHTKERMIDLEKEAEREKKKQQLKEHKKTLKERLQQQFFDQEADAGIIVELKIDTTTDDSLTKFVWIGIWFDEDTYTPDDLVAVNQSDHLLRDDVIVFFLSMEQAYRDATWVDFSINSARRSYDDQQELWNSSICYTPWRCAEPGHSEHQSWLAVDLWHMSWVRYERMKHNAHRYGFHQSYQKGMHVDGYVKENRHWRYVWEELATELYEQWKTFTEWVKENHWDVPQ